jgi:Asp-tRNA(Asn)/Glu-tRNA(Gln) amidotransferase A subunit family amidase
MITTLPSIAKIHALFRNGELTPRELVEQCLACIDHYEPDLQAWVSVDRTGALQRAEAQSRWLSIRPEHEPLPPLFGIPIGVKDIVDIASWPTQAGSPLRASHVAQTHAPVVARLLDAGAIVLGKTVTTEFACFDPSVTRNPWNHSRTPGGSSSGSAAAVARGMCVAAVGSQTGGSILRPASYCGVVGFKPSHGSVPVEGVVPVAPSLDHVGSLAHSVADAARMFGAMAGGSIGSLAAGESESPIRFGIVRGFFWEHAEPETAAVFDAVLVHLENLLGPAIEVSLPVDMAAVHRSHRQVMAFEAAAYHRLTFERAPEKFGPHVAKLIAEGLATSATEYAQALDVGVQFRSAAERALESCDVLAMPTTPGPAPGLATTGDPRWQSPWSLARLPAITLPCGFAALNLPLGLQLVADDDARLLHIAAQCEEELDLADEMERLLG